jgi:hypothetical protein
MTMQCQVHVKNVAVLENAACKAGKAGETPHVVCCCHSKGDAPTWTQHPCCLHSGCSHVVCVVVTHSLLVARSGRLALPWTAHSEHQEVWAGPSWSSFALKVRSLLLPGFQDPYKSVLLQSYTMVQLQSPLESQWLGHILMPSELICYLTQLAGATLSCIWFKATAFHGQPSQHGQCDVAGEAAAAQRALRSLQQ